MKSSLTYLKNHLVCFGAAALLLLSVSAAHAQVLLNVQIFGDDAVITASGTPIDVDSGVNTSVTIDKGVTLLDFFQNIQGTLGITPFVGAESTSLTAATISSPQTFNAYTTDEITGASFADLSLFWNSESTGPTMTFQSGDQAFVGSMTIDLSAFGSNIPTVGEGGTIDTSYSGIPPNTPIGSWQVISAPEPSTWMLLGAGAVLLAFWRLRLRSARNL